MLGIVIPCYNEEEALEELLRVFEELRKDREFDLIFVNDGSTDETGARLKETSQRNPWINVITHEKNQGMARSLKDGFSYAVREDYDLIAHMDADLTHPPVLLHEMMERIEEDVDLVIASRYVRGGGMADVPLWRVAISMLGNRIFRLLLGIKTRDATSGFRLAKREVFDGIDLETDSFGIQLESTVKAERAGFRIKEIPLLLETREKGVSKFRFRYLLDYIPLVVKLMVKR